MSGWAGVWPPALMVIYTEQDQSESTWRGGGSQMRCSDIVPFLLGLSNAFERQSSRRACLIWTYEARIGPPLLLPMTFEFTLAVATRTVLAFSPLEGLFQDDNQLSSPLTSYSRRKRLLLLSLYTLRRVLVQEGIYLFRHGIDPYGGGTFRHVRLLALSHHCPRN